MGPAEAAVQLMGRRDGRYGLDRFSPYLHPEVRDLYDRSYDDGAAEGPPAGEQG